jgi:AcrR family transcriptional regulator
VAVDDSTDGARRQRAERILDVAGDLLLRWGYQRITIEDVARQAGIGKGTVYLHWRTKEALFRSVLMREGLSLIEELLAALRRDPRDALPHRMMRTAFIGVLRRPLLRALILADREVMGRLAQDQRTQQIEGVLPGNAYPELLRKAGITPPGLTPEESLYSLGAITAGFFSQERGEQPRPEGVERRADVLANAVRRVLEPEGEVRPERLRELSESVIEMLESVAALVRGELAQAYD